MTTEVFENSEQRPGSRARTSELPLRKPLLSLILQREGVLSDEEVTAALAEWTARRRAGMVVAFGQVILGMGMLAPEELMPYLALQRKLAKPPGRKPLGLLLIENALLTPSQVILLLRLQEATGLPLGQLLIEEGLIREPQLEVLLRFQGRRPAGEEPAA